MVMRWDLGCAVKVRVESAATATAFDLPFLDSKGYLQARKFARDVVVGPKCDILEYEVFADAQLLED